MGLKQATTAALDDLSARLAHAADQVESSKAAYDLAVEQRNAAVVEAVDAGGMAQGVAARLVRVSQPHVVRILARASQALAS